MTSRYGAALRFAGIALLALAVSPVTAPFSTCGVMDLLPSGQDDQAADIVLQPKPPQDDPVAGLGRGLQSVHLESSRRPTPVRTTSAPAARHSSLVQLRI